MEIKFMDIPNGPGREELDLILSFLPKISFESGIYLAGGAVRRLAQGQSLIDGDLDFFFRKLNPSRLFEDEFKDHLDPPFVSSRAVTYKVPMGENEFKIQIIRRMFYKDLESLFNDFDFTVCQFATDGEKIAYTDQSLSDLRSNTLSFNRDKILDSRTLPMRFAKYVRYGFIPEPHMFTEVVKKGLTQSTRYIFSSASWAIKNSDMTSSNYCESEDELVFCDDADEFESKSDDTELIQDKTNDQ